MNPNAEFSGRERELQLQINQLLTFSNRLLEALTNAGVLDKKEFSEALQKEYEATYQLSGKATTTIYNLKPLV